MSEITPRAMGFYPTFYAGAISNGLSNISYVTGPTYVGTNNTNLLFPFSLSNGVLDIIVSNGFSLTQTPEPQMAGATVRISGGSRTVSNIGNNFRAYIKNRTWGQNTIPNASSISVFITASATLVQQLDERFVGHMSSEPYIVTTAVPPSNFAIPFSGFGVTYAFLTPLVIRARNQNNAFFYIIFVSNWDVASMPVT
jgi:hypothetical protein